MWDWKVGRCKIAPGFDRLSEVLAAPISQVICLSVLTYNNREFYVSQERYQSIMPKLAALTARWEIT